LGRLVRGRCLELQRQYRLSSALLSLETAQQVHERLAGDRDRELGRVREVDSAAGAAATVCARPRAIRVAGRARVAGSTRRSCSIVSPGRGQLPVVLPRHAARVHQMIVQLEKLGLIRCTRRQARSIELLVPEHSI
jgi:hypothetical protein